MEVQAVSSPRRRVMEFLAAFRQAPDDADIEVRVGMVENGPPAVLIAINGEQYPLLATEARKVAQGMDEAMRQHPDDPEAKTLPNIILMLRHGADKADAAFG